MNYSKEEEKYFSLIRYIRDDHNYIICSEMSSLIQSGIDVNMKNPYGLTILTIATQFVGKHTKEIMQILINAGADLNAQNKEDGTPIMVAIRYGGDYTIDMLRIS